MKEPQEYHKVEGQGECYQSHDGRASVQEFRHGETIEWLIFVDGRKLFSTRATKEAAIQAAEQKLAEAPDIHTATAAIIYQVKSEAVTPEMRNEAKRRNFGALYGRPGPLSSRSSRAKILEFENEADYNQARDLLINIHEEHPPEPAPRSFVLIAGELQASLLKGSLESLGIPFKEKDPNG